jgi:hypothetical protein
VNKNDFKHYSDIFYIFDEVLTIRTQREMPVSLYNKSIIITICNNRKKHQYHNRLLLSTQRHHRQLFETIEFHQVFHCLLCTQSKKEEQNHIVINVRFHRFHCWLQSDWQRTSISGVFKKGKSKNKCIYMKKQATNELFHPPVKGKIPQSRI